VGKVCPKGWISDGQGLANSCYKTVSVNVTGSGDRIAELAQRCSSISGTMVTLNSLAQFNAFLDTVVPSLMTSASEKVYIGYKPTALKSTILKLWDGSTPVYTPPWKSGEPSGDFNNGYCIETGGFFAGRAVNDYPCNGATKLICQYQNYKCPPGWTWDGQATNYNCYKNLNFYNDLNTAITNCNNVGGHLPVFNSRTDFNAFYDVALPIVFPSYETYKVLLGYVLTVTKGAIVQLDGKPPQFSDIPWGVNEPTGEGQCITTGSAAALRAFADFSCTSYYVCQLY